MKRVELIDYEDYNEESGEFGKVVIELDSRLSPSANAQRMYKRYNKCKNAERELAIQIEKAERELNYIYSVFDALAHAEPAATHTPCKSILYTKSALFTPFIRKFNTAGKSFSLFALTVMPSKTDSSSKKALRKATSFSAV